jgi:peptide/nickel transport system substrate-binding protein
MSPSSESFDQVGQSASRTLRHTRRAFVSITVGAGAAFLLSACGIRREPGNSSGGAAATQAPAQPASGQATQVAPAQAQPAAQAPKPAEAPAKPAQAALPTPIPAAQIKRGGILQGYEQLLPTLDPHVSTSHFLPTNSLLYDSMTRNVLVDPVAGKYEIKPGLAESWERTDDKTYVFKLRKNVKFHDGSDWNADVAKWNIERLKTHPKSVSKEVLDGIDTVEAVDPFTVKFNLKGPLASLPALLSVGGSWGRSRMVSKAAVEKLGDDAFGNSPSGTGPFVLQEWTKDQGVKLKRFDGYWEQGADGKALPYLDGIQTRFIPDTTTAMLELRAGTLDFMNVAPKDVPTAKSDPNLVYWEQPWNWSAKVLGLNAKQGVFVNNLKLRQAFGYAINYDALVKVLSPDTGAISRGPWSPNQPGWDDNAPRFTYDAAKAKQLMADAGYKDGVEVRMLTFSFPEYLQAAEVYQKMVAESGFRLVVDSLERLAWIAKAQKFEGWEIAFWGWGSVADPDTISRNLVSTGLGNWSGVGNKERDDLMAQGRGSYDVGKRADAYKKVWQTVYDEAHIHFTYQNNQNITSQKYVQGVSTEWVDWEGREAWLNK